jgi:hypothetical protein
MTIGEHQSEPKWRSYNASEHRNGKGGKLNDAVGLSSLGKFNDIVVPEERFEAQL